MGPSQDTLLRSADMSLTQLYIANEIGREVVSALGELGMVQFRDLNADTTAFQRTFTNEIRRLDNVERQLRYFQAQMEKESIEMRPSSEFANTLAAPMASEIDELAQRSESLEQRIFSLNESYEVLKRREVELIEWRWVLREAGGFFDRAHGHTDEIRQSLDNDEAPLLRDVEHQHPSRRQTDDVQHQPSFSVMDIGFVSGVIPRDRIGAFERILWRTLRGNLYMNQSEIPQPIIDPSNNEGIQKNVFVIFAHGKEIIAKIRKIAESLGANLYSVDENSELRRDQIHDANTRLSDVESVLRNTKVTLDAELSQIARSLAAWMIVVRKEKAVYHTLNQFSYDQARKTLIAEACHLDSLRKEIIQGLIYNDIFSRSLEIFPSAWQWPQDVQLGETVSATLKGNYRYPFGLDWGWHASSNNLLFTNSFKMKLAILLGWSHMTYSICLSFLNARHFKKPIEIWGNFVPGMIFFQSIFGYLVFSIIYKWLVDWPARGQSPPSLLNMLIFMFLKPGSVDEPLYKGQAGVQVVLLLLAVIQIPILLFLKPCYLRWEHNRARALGYRGLGEISRVSATDEDEHEPHGSTRHSMTSDAEGIGMITQDVGEEEHEEFDFGDEMIHQIIHTIEFCLNCVSHTASYLRLWALSLAHQQLSIVLWKMTLNNGFSAESSTTRVILIIVTFYVWFTLTVAVLCVIEGTSAMLHSLRLHWVEAMSKHFIGDGIPFTPFSFKILLQENPVD
ncbi:vacuolar ATP synthase 98 kDa subunit [Uncinocarpus reesii 1704]|uniref:V-type proton ATPase subunit a n=1 Tax=Uncinocarpus reesii (strain UAMH 1704) TaxID=336963 RepID=C4JS46_UNCRE|nr:vacuolar ATP synthase 98 kDa subunit [Uncinocarpus reesii 1704]EEP80443.1 vacuolar ATP synthase 98 kDa subunit [Uncinocarpus reesii 1704]